MNLSNLPPLDETNSPYLRTLITSSSSVVSQVSLHTAADWFTAFDYDLDAFLRTSKPQYRQFLRVVCRSAMFRHFIAVRHRLRGMPVCMYLFDQWASLRIHNKWSRKLSLWRTSALHESNQFENVGKSCRDSKTPTNNLVQDLVACQDVIQVARSGGNFHRRFVELVTRGNLSRILVYKDASKGVGASAIPKHDRIMLSQFLRVQGPANEKPNTSSPFSFYLRGVLSPEVIRAVLLSNQHIFVPVGLLLLQKKNNTAFAGVKVITTSSAAAASRLKNATLLENAEHNNNNVAGSEPSHISANSSSNRPPENGPVTPSMGPSHPHTVILSPDDSLLIATLDHIHIAIGQSPVQALISRIHTVDQLKKLVTLNELAATLLAMPVPNTSSVEMVDQQLPNNLSSGDVKLIGTINASKKSSDSSDLLEPVWPISIDKLLQFACDWDRSLEFKTESQYQRNLWLKILEARLLSSDIIRRYSSFN